MDSIQYTLNKIFGYQQFRTNQQEIIQHILNGKNAFVVMPTGIGKSLCYQLPALILDGTAIVVSPLIALMQDQVYTLQLLGVEAEYLSSCRSIQDNNLVLTKLLNKKIKILYITPERSISEQFVHILHKIKINLFAIDEAHCVSHWGHDFRPNYQKIYSMLIKFKQVPKIALTATADKFTKIDILHYLDLKNAKEFTTSFVRKNMLYLVQEKNNGKKQLLEFLKQYPKDSGIVYCNSRAQVDKIFEFLLDSGFNVSRYHAGLDNDTRFVAQESFLNDTKLIMVATIAFGLGINKTNIRYVYHFDMPRSIEQFYQESGRAGRDSLSAISVVNFGFKEIIDLSTIILQSDSDLLKKKYEINKLKSMLQYCDATICRQKILLKFFNEETNNCNKCDICLSNLNKKIYTHDHENEHSDKQISHTMLLNNTEQTYASTYNNQIDITDIAKKILSTIYKTGQKFNTSHIIDILRAKATNAVQIWEHHKLSTFGLCDNISEKELRRIVRIMYSRDIIDIDFLNNNIVKLNHAAVMIIKGLQNFCIINTQYNKQIILQNDLINNYKLQNTWLKTQLEHNIHLKLLKFRHQMALEYKTSYNAIFNDNTIYELVTKKPNTIMELSKINGFGDNKLKKFATQLLKLMHED